MISVCMYHYVSLLLFHPFIGGFFSKYGFTVLPHFKGLKPWDSDVVDGSCFPKPFIPKAVHVDQDSSPREMETRHQHLIIIYYHHIWVDFITTETCSTVLPKPGESMVLKGNYPLYIKAARFR